MSELIISKPMSGVPRPLARRGPENAALARALGELQVDQCRDVKASYLSADNIMKRVSRLRGHWPEREYQCRKENGAVRVWRVK